MLYIVSIRTVYIEIDDVFVSFFHDTKHVRALRLVVCQYESNYHIHNARTALKLNDDMMFMSSVQTPSSI